MRLSVLAYATIAAGLAAMAAGALAARGMDAEPFASYLDAFRYGMPPHGGFALGLERFVAQAIGAANIRETTLFPRDRNRLLP